MMLQKCAISAKNRACALLVSPKGKSIESRILEPRKRCARPRNIYPVLASRQGPLTRPPCLGGSRLHPKKNRAARPRHTPPCREDFQQQPRGKQKFKPDETDASPAHRGCGRPCENLNLFWL
jgi:hypothetical protein